jgi:hypothetical protein
VIWRDEDPPDDEPWDEERSWRESLYALVELHAESVDDDGLPDEDAPEWRTEAA